MIQIRVFLSTFLILVTTVTASAEIRETNFMADALGAVAQGDIIVLDIDNTILEPAQTLGSDQWYGYLVDKYKQSGLSEDRAIDRAISDWIQVQLVTGARPVENVTPALIKRIQSKNIMVIALTARPSELKIATTNQLSSSGVRLNDYNLAYNDGQDVDFYRGTLFVGPKNNKGVVLSQFFKAHNLNPKRLIFVDDKEKHVKNMDAVFTPTGIVNINYRYGAADARVKSFSAEISEAQWSYFQRMGGALLTDEEAEQLVPTEPDQIDNLSCEDAQYGRDHTLSVSRISQNRFNVIIITDLDVPGGHYSKDQYLGVGTISEAKVELKLYKNEIYVSTVQGSRDGVSVFGISMKCQ